MLDDERSAYALLLGELDVILSDDVEPAGEFRRVPLSLKGK